MVAEDLQGLLPKNFLRPCLLLLIREQPSHGYDLLVRLDELGFRRGDPGWLYRTLRSMEREGLVESRWELSESGPSRRTYRVSEEGEDWLHAWAGSLRETTKVVGRFLDRYEALDDAAARTMPGA
jgi:poly-beta-hydroxybutyrate-responsive repressor